MKSLHILKKNIKLVTCAFILGVPLIFSTAIHADSKKNSAELSKNHSIEHKEKRLNRLASKLELNEEQKNSLQALMQKHQEERKQALEPLRKKHKEALAGILSPEQLVKFEKMQHRKKSKHKKDKKQSAK